MSKSSESESDLPGSIHVTDDEDSMLTSDDYLGVSCITIYGVTVLTASIQYQMFKFEDKKEEEITAENKYLLEQMNAEAMRMSYEYLVQKEREEYDERMMMRRLN
jgi:hypothetical protein